MARIGRRHKKKRKGDNKYIQKIIATATTQPLAKRQRIKYRRQGSDTIKETITIDAIELSRIQLRNAIYYVYVATLDATHE